MKSLVSGSVNDRYDVGAGTYRTQNVSSSAGYMFTQNTQLLPVKYSK